MIRIPYVGPDDKPPQRGVIGMVWVNGMWIGTYRDTVQIWHEGYKDMGRGYWRHATKGPFVVVDESERLVPMLIDELQYHLSDL
jgi:hypothetical protein